MGDGIGYIIEDGELVECVECGQNIDAAEDYEELATGDYLCEDCASELGDDYDGDRTADDSFDEDGE